MNQLAIIEKMSATDIYGSNNIDNVLNAIASEAKAQAFDISTENGRDEVRSFAFKIARSKTFIDDCGKKLGEEASLKLNAINAERKKSRDFLDLLKEEVRKPLTDWEQAEKNRVDGHEQALKELGQTASFVAFNHSTMTTEKIESFLAKANATSIRNWQEFKSRADVELKLAIERITRGLEEARARDAQKAELERLRAAEAQRMQKDREEALARETAEREKKVAEEKIAAVQREKDAAEDRAIVAAATAKKEKEQAIEFERKKIADEKKAEADAVAKREANQKHKTRINGEILTGLRDCGLSSEEAIEVVAAIARGTVPHLKIIY